MFFSAAFLSGKGYNPPISGHESLQGGWGEAAFISKLPATGMSSPPPLLHLSGHCDTSGAIPHISRYFFREVSTPQNGVVPSLGT